MYCIPSAKENIIIVAPEKLLIFIFYATLGNTGISIKIFV